MLKNTIVTTMVMIISVILAVVGIPGTATFLPSMTTVFIHSGQQLGMMVEYQFLILLDTVLGILYGAFSVSCMSNIVKCREGL